MRIRTKVIGALYRQILKRILFLFDPETVHDNFIKLGRGLGKYKFFRAVTAQTFRYENPILEQTIAAIHFKNPIGLAAGFDKNAELMDIMPHVGFAFEEVGSVTAVHCEGNARPRLWRLKKSQGLVVNYGLKSLGAEKIAEIFKDRTFAMPIGISLAKTNCADTVATEGGVADYLTSYRKLKTYGDYITLNISCPNTFGGQPFTDSEKLDQLLKAIHQEGITKPLFIKLSPDLTPDQLQALIHVADRYPVAGFICTNLTKDRSRLQNKILDTNIPPTGGISGKPVQDLSDQMIKNLYKITKGRYVIIGCGGVFNGQDAYKKIRLGASLIQMVTGLIFQGPQVVGQINEELTQLLKKDGFSNISQAIGKDNQ